MPTTIGRATDFITFSRPSATSGGATVTDADGIIKWAGHNLLTNSESFDASTWTKSATTVSANVAATAAPNGTSTADKLAEDATTAAHRIQQGFNATIGATYTISVFAKAAERNWLQFLTNSFSGGNQAANFNLSNGTIGSGATGANLTKTITSVGGGWYLCTVTWTPDATGSNVYFYVLDSDAATGASYAGVAGNGVYLWGAHLYRSDLGGMALNPARGDTYYPTTPKNLLGYTEDFSNAVWVRSNTTIGPNAIAAPNGLVVADKLEAATNADIAGQQVYQALTTLGPGNYVYSVYAKQGSGATDANKFAVRDQTSATNLAVVSIDYSTGIITQTTGTGATSTDAGNGWWRISIPFIVSLAAGNSIRFNVGSTGTVETVGEFCYAWGAQVSDSGSLDPYVASPFAAVSSSAYYAPRRDFNGSTLAVNGILIEGSGQNLLLQSADFTTTWTTLTATVSANSTATTAPDGTTTSDKVIADNTAALDSSGVTQTITTAAATYTFSAYVKAAEYNRVRLLVRDDANAANAADVTVSLVDGTTAIAAANAGTFTGASVRTVAAGNNWYRVALTFTSTGATALRARILLSDSVATTGNGTSGIYVWGAQLESGIFASSYVPTLSTSFTRTGDVATIATTSFPFSATEGTYVVNFLPFEASLNYVLLSIDDGTASNYFRTQPGNSNHLRILVAGAQLINLDAGGFSSNVISKVGAAYKAADFAVVINNGTVATSTTAGTLPTVNRMSIGHLTNVSQLNGYIRQITYFPRRLTDTEVKERTV